MLVALCLFAIQKDYLLIIRNKYYKIHVILNKQLLCYIKNLYNVKNFEKKLYFLKPKTCTVDAVYHCVSWESNPQLYMNTCATTALDNPVVFSLELHTRFDILFGNRLQINMSQFVDLHRAAAFFLPALMLEVVLTNCRHCQSPRTYLEVNLSLISHHFPATLPPLILSGIVNSSEPSANQTSTHTFAYPSRT